MCWRKTEKIQRNTSEDFILIKVFGSGTVLSKQDQVINLP